MKVIPETYLMKVFPETYLMKVIPETYLMKVIPETYLMKVIPETWGERGRGEVGVRLLYEPPTTNQSEYRILRELYSLHFEHHFC